MAQYDIYPNPGQRKDEIPYLLDVQNNHITNVTDSTVVIPLRAGIQPIETIAPLITVPGQGDLVLSTGELFGIETSRLKKPIAVLNKADQTKIHPALDKVFGNY